GRTSSWRAGGPMCVKLACMQARNAFLRHPRACPEDRQRHHTLVRGTKDPNFVPAAMLGTSPTGCTHLSHASPDVPSVDHGEQAPVSLDEHDGSWLAAISGPAAEAGADPSGEGERAGRMWIFLSLCPAFEGARDGFEDGLIGGREQ